MSYIDLSLHDNGSGGELLKTSNDLEVTSTLFNIVYLALFGGGDTPASWWGNEFITDENKQVVSITEQVLNNTVLDIRGLGEVESSATQDLVVLKALGVTYEVDVELISAKRIGITVRIQETEDTETEIPLIWLATSRETNIKGLVG